SARHRPDGSELPQEDSSRSQRATGGKMTSGQRQPSRDVSASFDMDACERFKEAWAAGRPIAIEACLPAPEEPWYLPTLVELIKLELHWSWMRYKAQLEEQHPAGEALVTVRPGFKIEANSDRFPRLWASPEDFKVVVLKEYEVRQQFGDNPGLEHYRQ